MATDESLQCGRLTLKPHVGRAFWGEVDVNLTLSEFNIVRLLAKSAGEHVTYRAVYDCMRHEGFIAGSGEDGYRTNVRSSIKRIRNKFRAIDPDFAAIRTSFGYRWTGWRSATPASTWRRWRALRRAGASLTLKLGLTRSGAALPVICVRPVRPPIGPSRSRHPFGGCSTLVAKAISPLLSRTDPISDQTVANELLKYAAEGTALKLLFQPRTEGATRGFFFVASAPAIHADQLQSDLDELNQRGILKRLSDTCVAELPHEIRYHQPDGSVELLTSMVPVRNERGCWVLVSTHNTAAFLRTSIGQPYWETQPVRTAAVIGAVLLALAVLSALSIRRSLRQFREVAHEVHQGRIGENAFAKRNIVPELGSVARDFDRLVEDVHRVARDIRQSAEDNAHSFKTPLRPSVPRSDRCAARRRPTTSARSAPCRSSTPRSTACRCS